MVVPDPISVERQVYDYFVFLSWLGNAVDHDFALPKTSNRLSLDSSKYLWTFNVFAKAEKQGKMKLVVPSFVSALLKKMTHEILFQCICGGEIYGIKFKPEDAFESSLLILGLIYQHFQRWTPKAILFPGLIPEPYNKPIKLQPWVNQGPKVSEVGMLTEKQIEVL